MLANQKKISVNMKFGILKKIIKIFEMVKNVFEVRKMSILQKQKFSSYISKEF